LSRAGEVSGTVHVGGPGHCLLHSKKNKKKTQNRGGAGVIVSKEPCLSGLTMPPLSYVSLSSPGSSVKWAGHDPDPGLPEPALSLRREAGRLCVGGWGSLDLRDHVAWGRRRPGGHLWGGARPGVGICS
jgi:hypothetical protein